MTENPTLVRIEIAVGETCFWWSRIEHLVHDLCLHLASCLSMDFDHTNTRLPLHVALSNMGIRERIATAKALASQAPTAKRRFYDRLEKLLNSLDNDLRNERNRYVHDLWQLGDDNTTIERFQQRTVVSRSQARKLDLQVGTTKPYASVKEVEAFGHRLEEMFRALAELDEETAAMASELVRLEELRQSAPRES